MRIDAHQHFWRLARGDYGWLTPALGAIYRDFGPRDLEPLLQRHGIDATILVQAAPTQAETEFLLALAREAAFVAGVVGWVDFAAPNAAQAIGRLAREPRLIGLRPMVQDIPDEDWIVDRALVPAFDAMVDAGLVFDALVLPRHLSRVVKIAQRHPSLTIVVDHGAKPFIRDGTLEPWRTDLRAVAACPNTVCKMSGLVTEAPGSWTVAHLAPYFEAILDAFGARRLVWGSDWPVVDLAGGYDRWFEATSALLERLTPRERDQVLGENARRVYLARPSKEDHHAEVR